MAYSPDDFLICDILLLTEEAYSWWSTIVAVVLREKISWEFFQTEFKKKYVRKKYLEKKMREFLELHQGNRSVAEYEREFVYISKYAREIVPTEEEMCIQFEDGLDDEIRMMIEEFHKRGFVKLFSASSAKKTKDDFSRATSVSEHPNKNKTIQHDFRVPTRPADSVGSVRNAPKPNCRYCRKYHLGECRGKSRTCYRCGSTDPFIRNCPKLPKEDKDQKEKQISTFQKSRRPGQNNATKTTCMRMKDIVVRLEARAPSCTNAVRTSKEAIALDVIAGIFYLFDVIVYALIDSGSTHSYICTALVIENKLPIESTDY
ncbi:uncharacterized protein [Gossypium hirsutum]|uniref:Retrotransposon gag domain-containing protein n=1 Tax=Gossypium hirsutum TaxID=3635 RepID=A0ABM2Z8J6_GOSHI|nr:uncharacterized protein LOC121210982 [Gossypium hirsutum]